MSSATKKEKWRCEPFKPLFLLTLQAQKYSLWIDSFSVVHEVTRHLECKAHRVVLPHSLHHASLIVLQEEDPRVIYLLVTLGPVTMPRTSSQSTVANPGFLLTGRNVPLLGTEIQEPIISYFLEVHPLWKGGRHPTACTWLQHSTGATFRKGSSRTFRGILVAPTGALRMQSVPAEQRKPVESSFQRQPSPPRCPAPLGRLPAGAGAGCTLYGCQSSLQPGGCTPCCGKGGADTPRAGDEVSRARTRSARPRTPAVHSREEAQAAGSSTQPSAFQVRPGTAWTNALKFGNVTLRGLPAWCW